MQRKHLQAFLFDRDVKRIDFFIGRDHFTGQLNSLVAECPDAVVDHLFDDAEHRQDLHVNFFEIAFKVFGHDNYPNFPET